MARSITTLQVLVAYPDDVAEERATLDTVVEELNNTWSRTLGIQIELIDWKTHSWPNFGSDAQAVINEELGDKYDIFLGIMWMRFGEPTPRADSGTAEEFNRALQRFRINANDLRIMFYFKDAPPSSLKEVDTEQLDLIRDFKVRVDQEGGLYSEFSTADQFASAVRMHLSKQAQGWGKTWGITDGEAVGLVEPHGPTPTALVDESAETIENDDQEGFLDLVERSQEAFETLNEIMGRMSSSMLTYRIRIEERTKELNKLNEANADIKQRKRVINSTAEIMDQYSELLEADVPQFSKSYTSALDAMARAVSIWSEDSMDGLEQARSAYEQLKVLGKTQTEYCASVVSLRTQVSTVPRITSVFNRSKRHMILALDELIAELERGMGLTSEVIDHFQRILGEDENDHQSGIN